MRCVVQFVYGRNKLFKRLCSFSTSNIKSEHTRRASIVSLCISASWWSFLCIARSHIKWVKKIKIKLKNKNIFNFL